MAKKLRIYIGGKGDDAHSYKDCKSLKERNIYFWAYIKSRYPDEAWVWNGLDGWDCNKRLKDKEIPQSIQEQVENAVRQMDLPVTADKMDQILELAHEMRGLAQGIIDIGR